MRVYSSERGWRVVGTIVLAIALGCGSGSDGSHSGTTATGTPTPAPTLPPDGPAIAWASGVPFARRSDDGGLTWEVSLNRGGGFIFGLDFVDRDIGWVVGWSALGAILNGTTDGGATWEDQHENIDGGADEVFLHAVAFSDAQRGTAVGFKSSGPQQGSTLALVTTDGGGLWTVASITGLDDVPSPSLESVCLTEAGPGLALGRQVVEGVTHGVALATRDSGQHWENITARLPTLTMGAVVSCVGEAGFWIVGGRTLLYSADGGFSWTDRSDTAPGTASLQDASFLDASTGWVTGLDGQVRGRGLVYRTRDGGRTWVDRVLVDGLEGLFGARFAVAFLDERRGVIVATDTASFDPRDVQDLFSFATQDGGDTWTEGVVPVTGRRGPENIRDVDLVE